jgi:hypothetical protein
MIRTSRQVDERAYRESDDISVSLRWNRETGDISVLVEDTSRPRRAARPIVRRPLEQAWQPSGPSGFSHVP